MPFKFFLFFVRTVLLFLFRAFVIEAVWFAGQIFWWGCFLLPFMGAPKQKWTQEEEAALKAGVVKHGAGKWRTILKDPEFSTVLYLRSNVDLKV